MWRPLQFICSLSRLDSRDFQIVPYASWSAVGLQESFTIAELRGAPHSVYVESAPRGLTIGALLAIRTLASGPG
ncbi:Scr1 family TA system antitoxin-like transcriptional regulator [Sphaerisporangium sp. NPDC051011]|uniref:Scr1 family TA system antitoxin-like transcriptional regulator n=1 Tax=Sphaerisporangium sp. NPDC051011 TaxID=3155792 RepID=UPI003401003C